MKILFVGDVSKYSRTYRRYLIFKKILSNIEILKTEVDHTPGISKKKNFFL